MISSIDPAPITHPHLGNLLIYGCLEYEKAWAIQRSLVEQRIGDRCADTLLLLEHPPVFTIGRSGKDEHWNHNLDHGTNDGYPIYRIERGGSVTYHGPGQLIGYPILRLGSFCKGPKAYVRLLEEVLVRTVQEWGIEGRRIEGRPGIWVGDQDPVKIAAIGVHIQRGVTMHGFSLNVAMDLLPFRLVAPCGIEGCRVSSMADILGYPVQMASVRRRVTALFSECFRIRWTGHGDPSILK